MANLALGYETGSCIGHHTNTTMAEGSGEGVGIVGEGAAERTRRLIQVALARGVYISLASNVGGGGLSS